MTSREFAIIAHGDQLYGKLPYIIHLDMVAYITKTITQEPEAFDVAYLHDINDTKVRIEEIRHKFGAVVADNTVLINDPLGTRKERTRLSYQKFAAASVEQYRYALIVKPADRLANMMFSLWTLNIGKMKMYAKEHNDFYKATYRPNLCDELWEQIDMLRNGPFRQII